MRLSAAEWLSEVSAWRKSGRSASRYARERGLSVSSLGYWSKKLKLSDGKRLSHVVEAAAGSRMARVRQRRSAVATTPSAPVTPAALRLLVGKVSVEIRRDFDAETLGRLLAVLGGGGR